MNRVILAGLVSLFAASGALAADLPQAPPPPQVPAAYVPIVAPVYNWGGIYIGINGGYGFGTAKWTVSSQPSNTVNPNGGVVGGTLGANWQSGALVLGVEGDFDWSGITNSSAGAICSVTGKCQTGNTWLSTLRGRIGYAADRVLFYGTGGGVFGNIQTVTAGVTNTTSKVGWTAGVGVEVAFADNWTAKVEYLYANLGTGNVTCATVCSTANPPVPVPVSVGLIDNLVRAGINYKFNF